MSGPDDGQKGKKMDLQGIEPWTTPMLREYYTTKPQARIATLLFLALMEESEKRALIYYVIRERASVAGSKHRSWEERPA